MKTASNSLLTVPVYQRLENDLRDQVRAGRWRPGAALPSRRELAREYGVDLGTLQRAIAGLVADGTLRAQSRRGTTVAARPDAPPVTAEAGRTAEAVLGIITGFSPGGLSYSDGEHSWTQAALSSLERVFCGEGGVTRIFNRWRVAAPAIPFPQAIADLRVQGVDALVIMALQEDPDSLASALAVVEDNSLPVVFLTADPLDRPVPHVFYDQTAAGYQAAQHLIRRGWHRLVFLAPFTADWTEERLAGAASAVKHAGLPESALHIPIAHRERRPWNTDQEEAGYRAAQTAFEAGQMTDTGIIAANDSVAFGVLRAARAFGLSAGKHFALLGFDDHPQAGPAGLTSLRPPLEALGEEAGRLILRRLRGEQMGLQVRLRSHLIARASTFAAPLSRDKAVMETMR